MPKRKHQSIRKLFSRSEKEWIDKQEPPIDGKLHRMPKKGKAEKTAGSPLKHSVVFMQDPQGELHRYVYGKKLGEGHFARANLAEDIDDGKRVAIKIAKLRTKEGILLSAPKRKEIKADVRKERKILERLGELGAVLDREDKLLTAVLLFENGIPLAKADLECHSFGDRLIFAYQLLKKLESIHQKDIIHIDISCNNVLIRKPHDATIIDFGLSEYAPSGRYKPKHKKERGTKSYIAPWVVEDGYSAASDIYSLGEVFGQDLFKGFYQHPDDKRHHKASEVLTAAEQKEWAKIEKMIQLMTGKKEEDIPSIQDCLKYFDPKRIADLKGPAEKPAILHQKKAKEDSEDDQEEEKKEKLEAVATPSPKKRQRR